MEKKVQEANGEVCMYKIDVDELGDVAREAGVKAIPHVALVHKGKTVDCIFIPIIYRLRRTA